MRQMTFFDLEEFTQSPIRNYDPAWDELAPEQTPPVLEQVTTDTLRASNPNDCVLEQVNIFAPEHNHWIETYPVTRSGNKYWYYRYIWMEGRKLHHVHIPGGNVRSRPARERKEMVEIAIVDGQSPMEIEKLIRSWRIQAQ